MRVVAGIYRGRRLFAPRGMKTRPTADRVREALFSILFEVEGMTVLDLFAGTGAIGIEAISRGATRVTFVERDRAALLALRRNLGELGVSTALAEVMPIAVEHALPTLAAAGRRFDVIFADPPYEDAARALPGVVAAAPPLLVSRGTVILEHRSTDDPPDPSPGLQMTGLRRYGEAALAFYRVAEGIEGDR